jgi:xyloglucan-specific endo-beta-1,4-glucanase
MFSLLPVLARPLVSALPTELISRATQQCGQYQSQTSGAYTLATNGWGWSAGTGSQCSEIQSLTSGSLAWDTTWSWSGGATSVKSYTNVQTSISQKQLSAYKSIPTTWKWNYTGTDLNNNGVFRLLSSRTMASQADPIGADQNAYSRV